MGVVRNWDLSVLGTLGGALGNATRFAVYEHVVSSPAPVSAGEVAKIFGLHRTVARSHLEKLTTAGLVVVSLVAVILASIVAKPKTAQKAVPQKLD